MFPSRNVVLTLLGAFVFIVLGVLSVPVGAQKTYNEEPPQFNYNNLPQTSFSCNGRLTGRYYADVETDCQMFHVCVRMSKRDIQDFRFLCPNGTVFDQEHQVCIDYYQVVCHSGLGTNPLGQIFEIMKLSSPNKHVDLNFGKVPLVDPEFLGRNNIGEDFQAAEYNNNKLAARGNALNFSPAKNSLSSKQRDIFFNSSPTEAVRTTTSTTTTTTTTERPLVFREPISTQGEVQRTRYRVSNFRNNDPIDEPVQSTFNPSSTPRPAIFHSTFRTTDIFDVTTRPSVQTYQQQPSRFNDEHFLKLPSSQDTQTSKAAQFYVNTNNADYSTPEFRQPTVNPFIQTTTAAPRVYVTAKYYEQPSTTLPPYFSQRNDNSNSQSNYSPNEYTRGITNFNDNLRRIETTPTPLVSDQEVIIRGRGIAKTTYKNTQSLLQTSVSKAQFFSNTDKDQYSAQEVRKPSVNSLQSTTRDFVSTTFYEPTTTPTPFFQEPSRKTYQSTNEYRKANTTKVSRTFVPLSSTSEIQTPVESVNIKSAFQNNLSTQSNQRTGEFSTNRPTESPFVKVTTTRDYVSTSFYDQPTTTPYYNPFRKEGSQHKTYVPVEIIRHVVTTLPETTVTNPPTTSEQPPKISKVQAVHTKFPSSGFQPSKIFPGTEQPAYNSQDSVVVTTARPFVQKAQQVFQKTHSATSKDKSHIFFTNQEPKKYTEEPAVVSSDFEKRVRSRILKADSGRIVYTTTTTSAPTTTTVEDITTERPVRRGGRRRVNPNRQRQHRPTTFDPQLKYSRRSETLRRKELREQEKDEEIFSAEASVFPGRPKSNTYFQEEKKEVTAKDEVPAKKPATTSNGGNGPAYGRRIRPFRREQIELEAQRQLTTQSQTEDAVEKKQEERPHQNTRVVKRLRQKITARTTTTTTTEETPISTTYFPQTSTPAAAIVVTTQPPQNFLFSHSTFRPVSRVNIKTKTISRKPVAQVPEVPVAIPFTTTTEEPELVTASDDEILRKKQANQNRFTTVGLINIDDQTTTSTTTYRPYIVINKHSQNGTVIVKVTTKSTNKNQQQQSGFSPASFSAKKPIVTKIVKKGKTVVSTDDGPTKTPDYDYAYYNTDEDSEYISETSKDKAYGSKGSKIQSV